MNRKNVIIYLVIILLSFVVAIGFFRQEPTYSKVKKSLRMMSVFWKKLIIYFCQTKTVMCHGIYMKKM